MNSISMDSLIDSFCNVHLSDEYYGFKVSKEHENVIEKLSLVTLTDQLVQQLKKGEEEGKFK